MKHLFKSKIAYCYLFAALFLLFSGILGLLVGSTRLDLRDLFSEGASHQTTLRILLYVRLPRVLGSLFCGAALSVAGAVIQGVLSNRLASPSLIGVNAGAGLAVTLCSSLGLLGGWPLSLSAFLGAFGAALLVSWGAKAWGASRGTVILMGVALNALLGALSDTIITFSPELSITNSHFKIGDFSGITYLRLLPAIVIILISMLAVFTLSNALDVLTLGEHNARGLGMNTAAMRVIFLLLAALLAGTAVSLAGLLSFVGLLVPHAVRRVASPAACHLLPLSALFGGSFVSLCDTLARVIFAPYELPVGIIMAFLGAPFFLVILIRGKGGHEHD
ncbi:MAG: iron ABC transporter permease [Clostridia bacterium]|nr:iron ABC transporter permease [Clostridia bacterium]